MTRSVLNREHLSNEQPHRGGGEGKWGSEEPRRGMMTKTTKQGHRNWQRKIWGTMKDQEVGDEEVR